MKQVTSCPLCGSSERKLLFEALDVEYHVPGLFPILRCLQCRLAYTGIIPEPSELLSVYPSHYAEGPYGGAAKIYAKVRRLLARSREEFCKQLPIPTPPHPLARALDLGCGDGTVSAALRTAGWVTVGTDIRAESGKSCVSKGLPFVLSKAETLPFRSGTFDLVVASHVIEHLYRPQDAVMEICRVLAPGGRVEIVVPNFDALDRRIFNRHLFMGLSVPRHLSHFNGQSLRRVLEMGGLAGIEMSTLPGVIFGGSLLVRIGVDWGRIDGSSGLLRVFSHACIPIDVAAATIGQGSSILARAHRPTTVAPPSQPE